MIIGREDDKSQYLEYEDVEITTIKEPFHQQLERELLMQPKEDEPIRKINMKIKCNKERKNYMQEH